VIDTDEKEESSNNNITIIVSLKNVSRFRCTLWW
jgi:hypothetical protein